VPADDLNLELRVHHPAGGAVVRDYLTGSGSAGDFFAGHFRDPDAYRAKAREVDRRFDRAARERAVEALTVPAGGDPARLERFVEEEGFVVTTGQQPALFGGPLYNVYKALTLARLAGELEARLERPVLPVFWVGSEDHDFAEANHTWVVDLENELHRVEVPDPDPSRQPPLHRIPLGTEVEAAREIFLGALPDSDFSRPFADLLREAAVPGATLSSAFHALMQALLGRFGIVFTDAAHPTVKEASLPLLLEELERSAELEEVLTGTGRALEDAGYGQQVTVMEGGVNLFLENGRGRERLYRDEEGGFRLHGSGERVGTGEIRGRVQDDPAVLSPNVFLRPVAESAVFPTLAYVGGPGEMAYFAQMKDYFHALGVRMPVVHPRGSVTVVETKIRKVLEKFGLDVEGLDRPFHEVAGEIARDEVPPHVRKAMGTLRGSIARGVSEVEGEVKEIDPTLKGPVRHVRSVAFSALDDLEKKVVHALKRENEIALAQLEKAQLHLFPEGKPQERVLNPFYYLARYGDAFLDAVHQRLPVNLP
jgi:bacillithiol biosynthesis cysteine-adding enzyme BshC